MNLMISDDGFMKFDALIFEYLEWIAWFNE